MILETLYLVIAVAILGGLAGFTAIKANGLLKFFASWTLIIAIVAIGTVIVMSMLSVD